MENAYDFTEAERAWIKKAHDELLRRMRTIVEIHELFGNLTIAPDGSGLMLMGPAPKQEAATP